jgi:hypothetical protein
MKRFNILFFLIIIGILGVYQFFPFYETYSFKLINSIYFFGLSILYFILLFYEIYLNNQEMKNEKKKFNKSSIWITIIFFLVLIIFKNINIFESKTYLKAEGGNNYTLILKKNKKFKLQQWTSSGTYFYKGIYTVKNDTLTLVGNKELSNRFLIDTVFIKKNDSLIPKNHSNKFLIIN